MANNYVSTCVVVKLNTLENVKAAQEFYNLAQTFADEGCDEDSQPPVEGAGKEQWDDFLLTVRDNSYVSFQLFTNKNETTIVLGDEESVNVEELASFIQFLQNRFSLETAVFISWSETSAVFISWSETCSKLRVNEFNGGAVLVHKDHIEWQESSCTWFDRMCKELNISY